MQIKIDFEARASHHEWSNFKEMLGHKKETVRTVITKGNNADKMVYHLTRQLNAGLLR